MAAFLKTLQFSSVRASLGSFLASETDFLHRACIGGIRQVNYRTSNLHRIVADT